MRPVPLKGVRGESATVSTFLKRGSRARAARPGTSIATLVLCLFLAPLGVGPPVSGADNCEDHIQCWCFDENWNCIGYTYVINFMVVDWWGEDEGEYVYVDSWTICGSRSPRMGPDEDLTPPEVSVASPQPRNYLDTEGAIVEASAEDPESGIFSFDVRIDGSPLTPGAVIPLASFGPGPHLLTALAYNGEKLPREVKVPFTVSSSSPALDGDTPPTLNGNPEPAPVPFRRGDANSDGTVDASDPVAILGFLYLGSPESLPCKKSADSNDSGNLDMADAVYLLNFLFIGGSPPAEPFPGCARDPGSSALPCDSYAACR